MSDFDLIQHELMSAAGAELPPLSPTATADEYLSLALWVERMGNAVEWAKAEIIRTAYAAGGPDRAFYLSPRNYHGNTSLETVTSELRAAAREVATADDDELCDAAE